MPAKYGACQLEATYVHLIYLEVGDEWDMLLLWCKTECMPSAFLSCKGKGFPENAPVGTLLMT